MEPYKQILIIDGQGGRLGSQLAEALLPLAGQDAVLAVGANSMATAAMMKAGVRQAATGENAVVVACRTADIIIGPIGIVLADALMGEITPAMAVAVGQSRAKKILIPVNRCNTIVAGADSLSMAQLIQEAVRTVKALLQA